MKKLLRILILLSGFVYASHENVGITPQMRGLGESVVGSAYGVSAIFSNPAYLGFNNSFELLISYERPYGSEGILGLNSANLGAVYRGFGVSLGEYFLKLDEDTSGFYSEGLYSLSYGRATGAFGYGFNVNLYKFTDPRFGTSFTGGLDLGLCSRVSEYVSAGVFYKNITRSSIRGSNLPQYLDAGININIQNLSSTFVSFRMTPGSSPIFMLGEKVSLYKGLIDLYVGFNYGSDLKKASFGFGLNLNRFAINYAFSSNFELSPAHSIGLTYRR